MHFAWLIVALVTIDASGTTLHEARKNYFRHEYTLDYYISTYDKPMIAILDGITSMHQVVCADLSVGGGVGLSINCPFRVATERTIFAMPETLIGFFPDVGATYFLPRLDGEMGIYLGLTGHQLKAYDTVYVRPYNQLILDGLASLLTISPANELKLWNRV